MVMIMIQFDLHIEAATVPLIPILEIKDPGDHGPLILQPIHYGLRAGTFKGDVFHRKNGSQNFCYYKCFDICVYNFCEKRPLIWKIAFKV